MKHNTNQLLVGTTSSSLKAMRSICQSESSLDLMIEVQVSAFSKLRKKYPALDRNEAIKISMLNTCHLLKHEKTEKFCLAQVTTSKATPQMDWLRNHQAFVYGLKEQGASLRAISQAIYYRFHYKVSHTKIATYLKMEVLCHEDL